MNEARERFRECWEVLQLAMKGEPFTYDGQFVKLDRPITVRPHFDKAREISFFGAIGSPGSGEIMADMGLAPLSLSQFPDYMLVKILERWRRRMHERGHAAAPDAMLPVSTKCFIGDTDDDAREEARGHMARFYKLQAEHYTTDTTPWGDIKGYEQFAKIFANMRLMGDPAKNDPILERSLIGSPETVARRVNELRAIGFNYVLFSNAMHGVEREVRHRMMRRFAKEVIPLVNSLPVPETPVFEKVRAAE
jgi:alkanesulfonate monooxygenase SsuD/methylene tetrahydromethanopterin reductase-like flavin-dependent oxidoreductase (luciferase family)